MVNATINGIAISVEDGTTILEAARKVGVEIPTLCYLKEVNEIGACRVCVVEVEGQDRCVTACNNVVQEGMVIRTNTRKVRTTRKTNVKFILSQHDYECASCVRSGNCTLQSLANELNISEMPYDSILEKNKWDKTFPLIRENNKCIKCMRCVQICDNVQGMHVWDVVNTGSRTTVNVAKNRLIQETNCTLCGQCVVNCPVGALRERDDVGRVLDAVERIGMPEARIILSQAALYVACAPKSNSCYMAVDKAMELVKTTKTAPVPAHLQDAHYKSASKLGHGIGYKYAHDYPNHYVKQQYLPDGLEDVKFYEPTDNGYEKQIKTHLKKINSET